MRVKVILGSSTPSIESYYKAKTGKYQLVTPGEKLPAPQIEVIDMKQEKSRSLSQKLRGEIKETLGRGEKTILFINRRGFFTTALCRECGYTIQCPNCSSSLLYHYKEKKLVCSHCGYKAEANLFCPKCQNSSIAFLGMGTQRIEEEVHDAYPQAKIVRIDRDSVIKRGSHEKLFAAFSEGNANVLIGTQMVTKGLDLTDVSLVGIISADSMLNIPDFRASEYAFQQIMQVAGRASRKAILQTYNPEHYIIKHAVNLDYDGFYKEELRHREELFYPPFSQLINIVVHGRDEAQVKKHAEELRKTLFDPEITILGPVKAIIFKIRGEYRYHILLKGKDLDIMRKAAKESLEKFDLPREIRITIDVEPVSLL